MKKITVEKVVLFLAAGFQAWNFGLAGGFIEGRIGQVSIGGLLAGAVMNLSLAITASRYGGVTGRNRTRQATAAFIAMLLISPLIVSPVIYYSLPAVFLPEYPVLRALWSIGWPSLVDIAIVGAGAVTGKGLIALSETQGASQPAQGAAQTAPGAQRVRRTPTALRDQCAALSAQYACTEPHCGWMKSVDDLIAAAQDGRDPKSAATSAKAGHVKNKHPRPIAVDQALLINKE